MNKKIAYIFLLFALFIPTYLMIYNASQIYSDELKVDNVSLVEVVTYDGVKKEVTGKSEIRQYIQTVYDTKVITDARRSFDYENPVRLLFHKGKVIVEYSLYLSLDPDDCFAVDADGKTLLISSENASELLSTELSDYLYDYGSLPMMTVKRVDSYVPVYPSDYVWKMKKADGAFHDTSVQTTTAAENAVTVTGGAEYSFNFALEPDYADVTVYGPGDEILYTGLASNISEFGYTADASLRYVVNAEWQEDDGEYYGSATYVLSVTYDVPVSLEISAAQVTAGDIVTVTARNVNAGETLTLSTDRGYAADFYDAGGGVRAAMAAIPITGAETVVITVSSSDGGTPSTYEIKVDPGTFPKKNISSNDDYYNNHIKTEPQQIRNNTISQIMGMERTEKLWSGVFVLPYYGEILMDYGWNVTVNTGSPYRNQGLNISSEKGDPAVAANRGKVVYTGEMPDWGKVIVIEHGSGLKTWYCHLDSFSVNPGDIVEKGVEIGKCGTSGFFCTLYGNLFFAVSIGDTFVNPALLMNGELLNG